jgi:hypothetical protein
VAAGEVLYNPNDDTPPVYVVLEGMIRIVSLAGAVEDTVTTYSPGQFSGELLMIAGRRSIYRCQAVEASRLLELSAANLRMLISKDAELSDIFMKTFLVRRLAMASHGRTNVLMLGSRYSAETLALREFLTRDGHPFAYVDLDTERSAQELLDRFGVCSDDVPIVVCNGTQVLRNPTPRDVAQALGFNSNIDQSQVRDIVIVGAGPAGLAAAVYAASEGLNVLVIERAAPGGQAGSSSRIENYLGFPMGLSGQELANSAIAQSEKFGAKIMVARSVERLNCDEQPYRLSGTRYTRIRVDRQGSGRHLVAQAMAACEAALHARNEPAGRIRGRRREGGKCQTGGLCGRRGVDRHPHGASGAGRYVSERQPGWMPLRMRGARWHARSPPDSIQRQEPREVATSYGYFAGVSVLSLSCVRVSKSVAAWRSCNCSEGSPKARLTIRPRCTAGRSPIVLAQRWTCR